MEVELSWHVDLQSVQNSPRDAACVRDFTLPAKQGHIVPPCRPRSQSAIEILLCSLILWRLGSLTNAQPASGRDAQEVEIHAFCSRFFEVHKIRNASLMHHCLEAIFANKQSYKLQWHKSRKSCRTLWTTHVQLTCRCFEEVSLLEPLTSCLLIMYSCISFKQFDTCHLLLFNVVLLRDLISR